MSKRASEEKLLQSKIDKARVRTLEIMFIIIWITLLLAMLFLGWLYVFGVSVLEVYSRTVTKYSIFAISIIVTSVVGYLTWGRKKTTLKKAKEKYPSLSIVGIILDRKQRSSSRSITALSIAFFGLFIYDLYTPNIVNFITLVFILALLVLRVIHIFMFEYRIRKGYYGRNEYEAREIIQFILDHSSDIDFTDSGKPKQIITEQDLEQIKLSLKQGLVADAF